ncbi:HPr-rel-A system PqqD family peptide chaperone [Sphingopyxis sp. MWB1]|uniref:HPr-rel-A system PqqD family peptide chaperone n=1 Tax=Sphingopyxis sp. MWB1 TaxID=1537715 RepID=UPI00051A3801|nr:HPr-rel-A system PqqD family peptide chaperone [Sphingopyxis sp. MWB1]
MIERIYCAPPRDALRVEPLGELTAIFDRRSMQTHLVAAPVPEILAALDQQGCTAAALADRLAEQFDLQGDDDGDPDVAAILSDRLKELATLGLVKTR